MLMVSVDCVRWEGESRSRCLGNIRLAVTVRRMSVKGLHCQRNLTYTVKGQWLSMKTDPSAETDGRAVRAAAAAATRELRENCIVLFETCGGLDIAEWVVI